MKLIIKMTKKQRADNEYLVCLSLKNTKEEEASACLRTIPVAHANTITRPNILDTSNCFSRWHGRLKHPLDSRSV